MLRKISICSLTILVLCSMLIVSAAVASEKIALRVNQSEVMNVNAVDKVAIANPDIADVVVVSNSEILIVGKAPGMTTLYIWSLGKREGFQVEVDDGDIQIANEIKKSIGSDDLTVSKSGKTIILEGKVVSQYQKNRAEKIAEAYGEKVVNLLEMTKPVQVKFEAVIIEIDRQKSKELGIKWGTDAANAAGYFSFGQSASNTVSGSSVLGGLGTYNPINGQLSALLKNGSAKILSQPHIVTLSGDKANIMVGGQIPIPVSNQNGQISIEWKDYGIQLEILPEVNGEGLINNKVKADVSSLDWNSTHKVTLSSSMSIPSIKKNKAETAIMLSSGQTMAIGGLLSSETSKDVTKIPILSSLPILGQLFTSTSYTRGETELVILVTPTIVNPEDYLLQTTPEMKKFLQEDPLGGMKDGGKN